MAIRIDYTPVGALAQTAINVSKATKREAAEKRKQAVTLQNIQQYGATSRAAAAQRGATLRQVIAASAAATRQTQQLQAQAASQELARKFAAGETLSAQEHQLVRDTHVLNERDRVVRENAERAKQERESRRQHTPAQMQEMASLAKQIQAAQFDDQLDKDTRPEFLNGLMSKYEAIAKSPLGPIKPTAQDEANSRVVELAGRKGVFDKNGKFQAIDPSFKELQDAQNDQHDQIMDIMENSAAELTYAQGKQQWEDIYGKSQQQDRTSFLDALPPEQRQKLGALAQKNELPMEMIIDTMRTITPQALKQGEALGKDSVDILEDILIGRGLLQKEGDVDIAPEQRGSEFFKTWDELQPEQKEKAIKVFRRKEAAKQGRGGVVGLPQAPFGLGREQRFAPQTEAQFIEKAKANPQWLQDNFIKAPKENVWEGMTSKQRNQAYDNFVSSIQPGKRIPGFAEFEKKMKEHPEDLQFYRDEGAQ